MPYPCDIHDLNGCKLSCFDMTSLIHLTICPISDKFHQLKDSRRVPQGGEINFIQASSWGVARHVDSSREKWIKTSLKRLPWQFHPGLCRSRLHAAVRQRGPGPSLPRPPGPQPECNPDLPRVSIRGIPEPRPARISKPGAAVRVGCAP